MIENDTIDEYSRRGILEAHLRELRAALENNARGAGRIHQRVEAARAEIARIEQLLKEMKEMPK
jgi:hypothetical protein